MCKSAQHPPLLAILETFITQNRIGVPLKIYSLKPKVQPTEEAIENYRKAFMYKAFCFFNYYKNM